VLWCVCVVVVGPRQRNAFTLKALQSMCWRYEQLVSVRRRKIRMIQVRAYQVHPS
jgi:hypothetical protein